MSIPGDRDGLVLTFDRDDADDAGGPDELRVEGVVRYNEEEGCWVASIDWSALRHASDEPGHPLLTRRTEEGP
jgi:hypothetical protein